MYCLAKSVAQIAIHQLLTRDVTCGCPFQLCSSSLDGTFQKLSNLAAISSMDKGLLTSMMARQSGLDIKMSLISYLMVSQKCQQSGCNQHKHQQAMLACAAPHAP